MKWTQVIAMTTAVIHGTCGNGFRLLSDYKEAVRHYVEDIAAAHAITQAPCG
jgi:hypothetical protein